MKKSDIDFYKKLAKEMDWDELSYSIMGIEDTLPLMMESLSVKEIKEYELILLIYETEKQERIDKLNLRSSIEKFEYGVDFISSWNYEDFS